MALQSSLRLIKTKHHFQKLVKPSVILKLLKRSINPIHRLIVKLLRHAPISSEIIGPPKGFYLSTKDWVIHQKSTQNSASYEVIYPSHQTVRSAPKTLGHDFHWQFRLQTHYEFPNTFVAVVPNGRVWGDKGVVISPNDRLLADVSIELGALEPEQANRHSIFRQIKLPPLVEIDKTLALLSVGGGRDIYFHWMFDLLPRIHLLRCSHIPIDYIDNFIINKIHLPFQKETLSILGISSGKIIESHNNFHVKAKQLLVPSLPSIPAQIPKWVCDFLRQEFLLQPGKSQLNEYERIYISRNKAKHRRVLNEDSVLNFLEKLGFKNLVLESLSVTEQAEIFAAAKVVVAPHGGGLTNIVFCQPETKIIEFFSPDYVIPCYWGIGHHLGLEYYYLVGEGQASNQPEDLNHYLQRKNFVADLQKDMSININSLAKLMELANVK